MATPQQSAAWTRKRKRAASQEERVASALSPGNTINLPIAAAAGGLSLETKRGTADEEINRHLQINFELARVAEDKRPLEQQLSDLLNSSDDRKVVINHWTTRRIRNGVCEESKVFIYVENPNDPPKEWVKKFEMDPWVPMYGLTMTMIINTQSRSRFQFGFAEIEAQKKLRELVPPEIFEEYVLTGIIRYKGPSGVCYLIRKGRPTLAFRPAPDGSVMPIYPLAAMCTHPAGYFTGTWAGFLPPTDEVIAHIMLLQQGEHEFWKRCEQHRFDEVNSGI